MRFLSDKLYLLTLILLFSCKEVNREVENETILNNTKTNSKELVEEPIQDYLERTEQESENDTKKLVNWSDGNSYEYDFIDDLNITGNQNGNVFPIKIYRKNYPSNSNCKNKNCNWCNSIISPVSYSYEEYPNTENIWKYKSGSSILALLYNLGADIPKYTNDGDYDSGKFAIRTEWVLVCDYDDVNGYCSNRCYYESKNR